MHRIYDMFPFSDMEMSIMSISWIHRFVWMSPSMYVCLCIDLAVSVLVCVSLFFPPFIHLSVSLYLPPNIPQGGGVNGLGKGGPCIGVRGDVKIPSI